jgi:NitT/TauT family transport system substrate-binding protein
MEGDTMIKKILLLGLACLLLVMPGAPATAQDDLPTLTLFLGFVPNVQFAPVYVAIEKGYFAEEAGVNVVLEYGDENIGVERIAAGELDFGMISGEQVILARYGGRPLVYVYEWYQHYPVGVVAPVESGITTPMDLVGRAVGVPGRYGASYTGLRALLSANDLTEADIQVEEIGFTAPAMVCAGRVEASIIYLANEPVQIEDQCSAVNVIAISDQVDLLANGIVTNEDTLNNSPELVRGMVRAFDRALADTIADPDEALRLSRAHVETLPQGAGRIATSIAAADALRVLTAAENGLSAEETTALIETLSAAVNNEEVVQMRVLLNSIALWNGSRLGETDPASWETTMATLIDMTLLPGPVDLTGAYTNDFLP